MSRVIIAGGSGFLGRSLIDAFRKDGHEVVVLARHPKPVEGARVLVWDAKTAGEWLKELDGAYAIVNLAGEPVAQRWTEDAKRRIVSSRVDSVKAVAVAIQQVPTPPEVWINASAIGYYGDTGDREVDESAPPGAGFLAETCVKWEKAVEESQTLETRKVRLRIGVVLGKDGGALAPLLKLARLFHGGAAGDGRQFMPWIHVEDLARMFVWSAGNNGISGPLNGVAPVPARNAEFMKALRHAVRRPWSPPAPAFAIKLGAKVMGVEPEILLDGFRVVPSVAVKGGFRWEYGDLDQALKNLVAGVN